MKHKKLIIAIISLLIIGIITYYFVTRNDSVTTLNLIEKQWIESNKNKIIDMSIINDVPTLSHNGEGLILDFLDSLKNQTGLSFNKISYKLTEDVKTEYAFKVSDQISQNDILIYTDNYVLVTKDKTYNSLNDLNGLVIGVMNGDLEKTNNYLFNANTTYKPFESMELMLDEFNKEDTTINAIVLQKTSNLKTIITNNYKIAYNINDYKKYYVLTLGNEERLNSILTKYYNKWSSDNYSTSYNKNLAKNYFSFKNITDSETVKFRSKRYYYGFISNAPYDAVKNGEQAGINYELLSNFSKLTNAEISYKKYSNIEDLIKAFNSNQIDIFYGINADSEYTIDTVKTNPITNNNIFIIKHSSNNLTIDSIKSLNDVMVIKGSSLEAYLTKNNVTVKSYSSLDKLISDVNEKSVVALDLMNYNYYSKKLSNFIIAYQFNVDNYSYVIRNISDNKLFIDMLDFYISFNNNDSYINAGLNNLLLVNKTPIILKRVALILGSVVGILLIVLSIIKIKPKKKKSTFTKEDKLRYIDSLTSLKNRNYLNDSIEKWDNSDIYPQTIIIVDLNNIAYVNDNYGHAEGDEVIKQASNILILDQIANSDIIRTNGNEFLIYLVGYDEKQVVTYMRKLNKELKDLKHGFGAAIGYSMINDAIKTIDDAINEATLDMRNNKEEITKE